MTIRVLTLAALVASAPLAALAKMPAVGDIAGTDPTAASAALEAAGCKVSEFEAEGGKIEAKCVETETGKAWEVYIDPKTGAVSEIKDEAN